MTTLPSAMRATSMSACGDHGDRRIARRNLPRYALEDVSGDVEVRVDGVHVVLLLERVDELDQLHGAVLVERDQALWPVGDLRLLHLDPRVDQGRSDRGEIGRL